MAKRKVFVVHRSADRFNLLVTADDCTYIVFFSCLVEIVGVSQTTHSYLLYTDLGECERCGFGCGLVSSFVLKV